MPKTLIKSRLHSNKHKTKHKKELNKTQPNLAQNLQSFNQKLLSGSDFVEYKMFFTL